MKKNRWWKEMGFDSFPVKPYIGLVVILFIFWLLLSGTFTVKFFCYGIATSLISAWVCMPLLMVKEKDGKTGHFLFGAPVGRFLLYCLWLGKELVKSNWDVAKTSLTPNMPADPHVIRFRMNLKNPVAKALLADSITLTPGTVTLDITDDCVYVIHALTAGAAEGIRDGAMQRRVAALYGEDDTVEILEGGEAQ